MDVNVISRNRILKDGDDVWTHNAWDNTEWTSEMVEEAERKIQEQRLFHAGCKTKIEDEIVRIESGVQDSWNEFYLAHRDKFFKDRRWLYSEFPEIFSLLNSDSPPCRILEIGCGAGNTMASIIKSNNNQNLHIYCCDISNEAIETLKSRDIYKENSEKITAFQANVAEDFETIRDIVGLHSLDFVTIIFTLSAFKPSMMQRAIENLAGLLKTNGMILFRDYGKYDLTQMRFKGKAYLADNYYARADGTTSYFFTKKQVKELFINAGLDKVDVTEDNRVLVNRGKSLKMYRCWIQAKCKMLNSGP